MYIFTIGLTCLTGKDAKNSKNVCQRNVYNGTNAKNENVLPLARHLRRKTLKYYSTRYPLKISSETDLALISIYMRPLPSSDLLGIYLSVDCHALFACKSHGFTSYVRRNTMPRRWRYIQPGNITQAGAYFSMTSGTGSFFLIKNL